MGPLNLSARMRLATFDEFDMTGYASLALNTMATEEIKNSALGRDVTTVGMVLRRETNDFYLENGLSVTLEGDAQRKIDGLSYTYHYGKVIGAMVRAGGKKRGFEFGGFAEVLLADSLRIDGGDGSATSLMQKDGELGRFRIISLGPEFAYSKGLWRVATTARWVADSTPGASLDDLGDLMGRGVGQGFISLSASLRF